MMQEQQRDLIHLERSINELNSLFLDVTTLLDAQVTTTDNQFIWYVDDDILKGDALSEIAKSTSHAVDKTAKSRSNLEKAEKLVKKRRKKCMIVISAIVGVVLIILAITLAPLAAAI